MVALTLTDDQQSAYESFVGFISDPTAEVFVLSGYAGTGKSTLVNHIIDTLPNILQLASMIHRSAKEWELILTATTNKAAQALHDIVHREVVTIQSALSLTVSKSWLTGESVLIPTGKTATPEDAIVVIDEASFIDQALLQIILNTCKNCKIVFIGDPAQLAPIKSQSTPVFSSGFIEAKLTKVVRQAEGNQIIKLATAFRDTVNTSEWFSFLPDGQAIHHMQRDDFDAAIKEEFTAPTWAYTDSKVLAWTNKAVIGYNQGIRALVAGEPDLQVGDYAVCNNYSTRKGKWSIKTDQIVYISDVTPATQHGVDGFLVEMDSNKRAFMAKHQQDVKKLLKQLKAKGSRGIATEIETEWVDLRAAYSCTINKSQGSTYRKVFIDLDDIKRCRTPNTVARLMYVAVSRASEQVIMTGDLV